MNISHINSFCSHPKKIKSVDEIKARYIDNLLVGKDTKESLTIATQDVCELYTDKYCKKENLEDQNENSHKSIDHMAKGFFLIDDLTAFFENLLKTN